eukprot:4310709-Amphidinium_carterae.2
MIEKLSTDPTKAGKTRNSVALTVRSSQTSVCEPSFVFGLPIKAKHTVLAAMPDESMLLADAVSSDPALLFGGAAVVAAVVAVVSLTAGGGDRTDGANESKLPPWANVVQVMQ